VREAAIDDWITALVGFPRQAIEAACEIYLRDQPRRRPTPGEIAARADGWQQQRARESIGGESASDAQRRVVEWAVMTGRMTRDQAWQAVADAGSLNTPDWMPDDEAWRCLYAVMESPDCMTPDDAGVQHYRKMVRA